MEIKIIDIEPTDEGKVRMYYTEDDNAIKAILLEKNDIASIQTVKNAVTDLLKGKKYIGQSFNIEG